MKKTLMIVALFAAFGASATEQPKPPKKNVHHNNVAAAQSVASSYSSSGAAADARGGAATSSSAGGSGGGGGSAGIYQEASNRAATAYAAPVMGTNGTCLGGKSGGIQGNLGVSFSSTTLDVGCDARYDAALLFNMGLQDAAIARLCQKPETAKALGDRCPSEPAAEQKASQTNVRPDPALL